MLMMNRRAIRKETHFSFPYTPLRNEMPAKICGNILGPSAPKSPRGSFRARD